MRRPASQVDHDVKSASQPLLSVRGVHVHFRAAGGPFWNRRRSVLRAVDGVSFDISAGETFVLVGESGSGKSTTARAIVGLTPIDSGEILLAGRRISGLTPRDMRPYRRQLQMIFQDPFASLDPRMTAGQAITEPLTIFGLHAKSDRKFEAMRLMELVGLNPRQLNRYPHEFSGGQRQRIGIARALAAEPKLIVCDEPVSALDVSVQAQVINLLMDLQQRLGLALLLIAHDLSVVRHISRRIGVMYLGRLVESASAADLFNNPRHPYTQALLSAAPIPNPSRERQRRRIVLTGEVPSPENVYAGCPFADRCVRVEPRCRTHAPALLGNVHAVSCWPAQEELGIATAERADSIPTSH